MNCRPVRRKLQPLLDGRLAERQVAAIHAHLLQCPSCQAEFAELRAIDKAFSAESVISPPPELAPRIATTAVQRILRRRPALVPRWLEALTFGSLAIVLVVTAALAFPFAHTFFPALRLADTILLTLSLGLAAFGSIYYSAQG